MTDQSSNSDDGSGRLRIVGGAVGLVAAAVAGTLWWVRRHRRT